MEKERETKDKEERKTRGVKVLDLDEMKESENPDTRAVAEIVERYLKKILETAETRMDKAQMEDKVQILENIYREMKKAALPETFKIGRQSFFRLMGDGCIFGIGKEELSKAKVTEGDFLSFHLAIYKALSNQSRVSGNQDTHSGISRIIAKAATKELKAEIGQKAEQEKNPKKRKALEKAAIHTEAYKGEIVVSLHELCKDGYGDAKATTLHKKAMEAIIKFLDTHPITVHYANGDVQGTYLCKIESFYKVRGGTTLYHLYLNPAYTENVARNFGELPQDVMKLLTGSTKKVTPAHKLLTIRLSLQDKKTPYTRTVEELLEEIGVDIKAYRKNPSRVERQVIEICDTMVKMGVAESYTPTYTTSARGRAQLRKVTFYREKDSGKETAKR